MQHGSNGLVLDQNQIDGVKFCTSRLSSIVAFGTGVGKTLTAIVSALEYMKEYSDLRVFVVCPASAMKQWAHRTGDLYKFFGIVPNIYTAGKVVPIPASKWYVFNYTSIESFLDVINEVLWKHKVVLIMDEAHNVSEATIEKQKIQHKVPQADGSVKVVRDEKWDYRSSTYKFFTRLVRRCAVRIALTATVVQNDIMKTWGLVDLVEKGYLGSRKDFEARYITFRRLKYGDKTIPELDGYKRLGELSERLKPLVIVRNLPYKVDFKFHEVVLSKELERALNFAAKGITTTRQSYAASRLSDLQRVVDCSSDIFKDEQYKLPEGFVSEKELYLLRLLAELFQKHESVLIYTTHTSTVDRLRDLLEAARELIGLDKVYEITGSVSKKKRYAQVDQISDRDVCIVTSAGSESLNIPQVDHIILYSVPFSIRELLQFIGRVTRKTVVDVQKYVHFLTTLDTIDEYKVEFVRMKVSTAVGITGDVPTLDFSILEYDLDYKKHLSSRLLWRKGRKR